MELKDKVVVVTGSSSGIGKRTAIAFAKAGARVAVTYNQGEGSGVEVVQKCNRHSYAALFRLDVRDTYSIGSLVDGVQDVFGGIDILVNNAGVIKWTNLIQQSLDDIREQVRVNLTGLIMVTRAFLPYLLERKDGVIINVASGVSKEPFPELTTYCGTKYGVRGFTQALALELPKGIRTYCVNPDMTATRMTDYRGDDPEKVAGVIVDTAMEVLGKSSGDDIDVWDHIQ